MGGLVRCPKCQVVGNANPIVSQSPQEKPRSQWGCATCVGGIVLYLFLHLTFSSNFRQGVFSIFSGERRQSAETAANSGGKPRAKLEQKTDSAQYDQQSPNAPMPDDQYYDYLKSKYAYESDMAVRVGLMRKYLNAYSQGRHIGEAMALLEKAESDLANWNKEQSQGGVLVECKAQLGSGQTALVQGYIQLFESATPLGDLISVADSQVSENAKALGEDTYVCAFGKNLRTLLSSQRLIAQANINNGQVVFRGLPANKVLIVYGSGMAGMNFMGYCDSFMSVGGRSLTIQPNNLTHYCRSSGFVDGDLTAKVLLYDWRPVGRE